MRPVSRTHDDETGSAFSEIFRRYLSIDFVRFE